MELAGIFAAITTPFDQSGNLYIAKIGRNVSRWNRTALSGYLVCGLAGEGVLLSNKEKIRVWEETARHAKPDAILLASVGGGSVAETVQLCNRVAEFGYHAVLTAPPPAGVMQWKALQSQVLFHRAVADQVKLPVVIDHRADALDLPDDAVTALGEHPNIIGVNDSRGNLENLQQLIAAAPSGFQVLTGCPTRLASAMIRGASGAIAGLASAAPFFCLNIEEAVRTREHDAALSLQKLMVPAADALEIRYGAAGLKYAMDLNGYYGGPARLPLLPLDQDAKRHIEKLFRDIKS